MKKIKNILQIISIVTLFAILIGCQPTRSEKTDKQVETKPVESTAKQETSTQEEQTLSGTSTVEQESTVPDINELFELKLFSDKEIYKTTDKIRIWATLKYIGKNNAIKIWHGDPYILFYISDGKGFNTGGTVNDVLISTILEKNKLYTFEHLKSGGYSEDDPKADFWRKFYAEKDLYLPEGEYTVKASGAFSLTDKPEGRDSGLLKELKIKVIQ